MKEDGLTAETQRTQRFRRAENKRGPAEFWQHLQNYYDLECERQVRAVGDVVFE